MTRKELAEQVGEELKHSPNWPGEYQNYRRAADNMDRRASLGKKAANDRSAGDVLRGCVARLRDKFPGADFVFDAEFFRS